MRAISLSTTLHPIPAPAAQGRVSGTCLGGQRAPAARGGARAGLITPPRKAFAGSALRVSAGGQCRAACAPALVVMAARGYSYADAVVAKGLLDEEGFTYLDVQSSPEFADQHWKDAVNIPLKNSEVKGGQLVDNPGFIAMVEQQFPDKKQPLLLGCWTGTRAEMAGEKLSAAGYETLVVIEGGFRAWNRKWNSSGKPRSNGVFVDTGPTTWTDSGNDPDAWGQKSNQTPMG